MREIKFRAWDCADIGAYASATDPRRMSFYGNDFEMDDDLNRLSFITPPRKAVPLGDRNPMKRFTLMQFTGLRDKDGNEIYEGDVVSWDLGVGGNRQIEWNGTDCEWQAWWNLGFLKLTLHKAAYMVVIGNIYENPELLQ